MKTYRMKCPKCGYTYTVESEPYPVESCPLCGHKGPFDDFVWGKPK